MADENPDRPIDIIPVPDCTLCPLHNNAINKVWGVGPKNPKFMIVGEGPGPEENRIGLPFVTTAPAGAMLTQLLAEVGVDRDDVYITNATRCYKGPRGKIDAKDIRACKPYLMDEIEKVNPEYIIVVGNEASKATIGRAQITKDHGIVHVVDGRNYFPIIHPAAALPFRTPEYRDVIKKDLANLVARAGLAKSPLDSVDIRLVRTPEEFKAFIKEYERAPRNGLFSFDFETNSITSPYHITKPLISGMAIAWRTDQAWFIPLDHLNPYIWPSIIDYRNVITFFREFLTSDRKKIGQNNKYEFLWANGVLNVWIKNLHCDVMLLSHVLNPERGIHGLDKLAWRVGFGGYEQELEKYFHDMRIKEEDRNYTMVPLDILYRYAGGDVIVPLRYYDEFYPELISQNQQQAFHEITMKGPETFAHIESRGQLVDRRYLDRLEKYLDKEIQRLQVELYRDGNLPADFNLGSPQKLSQFLTDWLRIKFELLDEATYFDDDAYTIKIQQVRAFHVAANGDSRLNRAFTEFSERTNVVTGTGTLSTGKAVITGLASFWPLTVRQKRFLENYLQYKKLTKRQSTNVAGLIKFICPDGRVRSSYLQHGTETGRRSGTNPNPQNQVKERVMRRIYIAPINHLLILPDYKNLEVRIPANMSGDPSLIEAIKTGKDIHSLVASRAKKIDYDEFVRIRNDKDHERFSEFNKIRDGAKISLFTVFYGGDEYKVAKTLAITVDEAREVIEDGIYKTFPGLRELFQQLTNEAYTKGYATNGYGFRRYLLGIQSSRQGVANRAVRQGKNTPIQGTAAYIVLQAMNKMTDYFKRLWERGQFPGIVQEVHDSTPAEAHYTQALNIAHRMKQIMESIHPPLHPIHVPYEVDIRIGRHGGSLMTLEEAMQFANDPIGLYRECTRDLQFDPIFYLDKKPTVGLVSLEDVVLAESELTGEIKRGQNRRVI